MKNSKGVSLIALIITIIVIIILAAIVMNSASDTIGNSQLAAFTSSFDDYNSTIQTAKANLQLSLGTRDVTANDPQLYIMTANGIKTIASGDDIANRILPAGYKIPKIIRDIYYISGDETVVAYVINDKAIANYGNKNGARFGGAASYEFYGDSNGEECHFITSNGHVFTIPGFAVNCSDGTIQFYISNERRCNYVAVGNSNVAKGQVNVNGDVVVAEDPILYTDFTETDSDANAATGLFGKDSKGKSDSLEGADYKHGKTTPNYVPASNDNSIYCF